MISRARRKEAFRRQQARDEAEIDSLDMFCECGDAKCGTGSLCSLNYDERVEWDLWRQDRDKLFDCWVCACPVLLTTGPGRLYRCADNYYRVLPVDLPVATCVACGETYWTIEEIEYRDSLSRG